ncbi:SRPBCC domain-containing protein [Paucisalibacillus sp. EB02]|uniref:SRPBCC domain-containing protein n=1 Tax=Paucisalibacillus sp. EB02 TaxID=1347087 RepID=UPI0005A6365B|nr:SRPBCC domain-containing protein [Paucisalibacillus sp. EB02]
MAKVKESIKREVVVNAPLEKVWDALTKEEHLNKWYTKEAMIDFRVGGKGYMNHGWGSTSEGVYTEIEPMKRFILQGSDGDFRTITEINEVENGVKVSIEYQASFIAEMNDSIKENMLFGTGQFLENLKSVYELGLDNREELWRTWIGITHTTDQAGIGSEVLTVKEGTSADKAGLQPGDIITNLDHNKVYGYESFERLLNLKDIKEIVILRVLRDKTEMEIKCLVEPYPVAY